LIQLINIYNKMKDRCCDSLKWGDEIEYMICKASNNDKIQLVLRGEDIFEDLDSTQTDELWRPEFASYMLEGTPGQPYGSTLKDLLKVEKSMIRRRRQVEEKLNPDEYLISYSTFPRLGCPLFTSPEYTINDPVKDNPLTESEFFPEGAINRHPRFGTLARNIRNRRGRKVQINVPIFKDSKTQLPYLDNVKTDESKSAQKENFIYMDAMGFGMGNSCLQVTFQASSIDEALHLYDQLIPLTPVMLALSAASPIFRGILADVDTRWAVISASVDCRTLEENGTKPLKNDRFIIPKSRYASVSSYLSDENQNMNDIELVIDQEAEKFLNEKGMNPVLSRHFSHLWIRDPMTLWKDGIEIDDETQSDHFENIQSTNWQTLRFKPPPPNSPIGWRVEFRPMEVQFTEYENAAYSIFIVLVTRVMLSYNLNLTIPISYVEENMKRAEVRDAVSSQKFYFRINLDEKEPIVEELTINEIINGGKGFPGLIPFMHRFLQDTATEIETSCKVKDYLDLIASRSKNELMTSAGWIRHFVLNHPEYKSDSIVNDKIVHDLTLEIDNFVHKKTNNPLLLPPRCCT